MSAPTPPYMMGPSSDLLVLSKMADGFALTNQNIAGVNTEICQATASVLAGTERQSLNLLTSTERNGSDVRLAVERNGNDTRTVVNSSGVSNVLATERNGNDTRTVVNANGTASLVAVERNGGDTRQVVVQQTGDVKSAVADSRSLIQNSVRDGTQWITQQQAATIAAVERNASENRATTTTEAATGRIQSSAAFSGVESSIARVGYENSSKIADGATANAIAAKDIQIQNLQIKADLALQASGNASTARMDTFQGVKSVQEQLCRAELDAYKHKEALAAQMTAQTSLNHLAIKNAELEAFKNREELSKQLQRAEVEAIKAAALAAKQLSDCCCEIKEKVASTAASAQLEAFKMAAAAQKAADDCCCELKEKIDAGANATELLIKREVENKLRDDNIVARLGGSGSALAVPAGYAGAGYGGGPSFPGAWGGGFPGYGGGYGGGYPGFGYPGVVPVVEVGGRGGYRGRDGRDGRDSCDEDKHHHESPRRRD